MTPLMLATLALFAVLGSIAFVESQYRSGKIDRIKCRKRTCTLNTVGVMLLLVAIGLVHNSDFNC